MTNNNTPHINLCNSLKLNESQFPWASDSVVRQAKAQYLNLMFQEQCQRPITHADRLNNQERTK